MKEIIISANDAGQRVDRFLKKYLANAPLSAIYKLIRKDVKLNGKRAAENAMLNEGDILALYLPDAEIEAYAKKKKTHHAKRQFTICYEDSNVIVVNKPFGLLVHGDENEKKDTLANQVVDYLIESGSYNPRAEKSFTPSPVHRLDRNTTGLVIFGKNAAALRTLAAMLKEDGCVSKYYYCILCGELKEELHLKNKLEKDPVKNRVKVLPVDSPDGKYIETIARPIECSRGYTFCEVELVTGRSHQIRAHMAHAGYPLLGDVKYGGRKTPLGTQLLHAGKLVFDAPVAPLEYLAGKEITSPLPWSFKEEIQNGKRKY